MRPWTWRPCYGAWGRSRMTELPRPQFSILARLAVPAPEFIRQWSEHYHDPREHLYEENIGRPLTAGRIRLLYEWKNGGTLAARKALTVEANFHLKSQRAGGSWRSQSRGLPAAFPNRRRDLASILVAPMAARTLPYIRSACASCHAVASNWSSRRIATKRRSANSIVHRGISSIPQRIRRTPVAAG
jgi:hypothetical protein